MTLAWQKAKDSACSDVLKDEDVTNSPAQIGSVFFLRVFLWGYF